MYCTSATMKYIIHINLTEKEKLEWEEFLSRPSKPGEEDRKQSERIHSYRAMAVHLAGNRGGKHTPYICIEITSYIGEARAWKWLGSTAASESLAGPHVLTLPDEQEEYEVVLFCNNQPITMEESNA